MAVATAAAVAATRYHQGRQGCQHNVKASRSKSNPPFPLCFICYQKGLPTFRVSLPTSVKGSDNPTWLPEGSSQVEPSLIITVQKHGVSVRN